MENINFNNYSNNIKKKILLKIFEYEKIICLHHISPDGDAYGSTFGIANFIKENFPNKIVLVDSNEKNKNNIFFDKYDFVKKEDYFNSLIIINDTANIKRISSLYWKKGNFIINIDHHPDNSLFGDIKWVDKNKIATSELVAEFIFYSKLKVSPKTASYLYFGIITDSNRFLYNTNYKTLYLSSKLLKIGFDVQKIYQILYNENLNEVKFKNYLFSKLKLTKNGVGYIIISNKMLIKFNMKYDIVKSWVYILSNINEIKIWVFFVENKNENYINVSIRSRKYFINKIAKLYDGGGHYFASGIKIFNWKKIFNIINDLDNLIINKK